VCSAKAHRVLIYRAAKDIVDASCRAAGARVLPATRLASGRLVAHAAAVTGNGSNDSPFTAPCDDPQDTDCTVSAFAKRTLSGSWVNEYVPAYECPGDHPYVVSKGYAPPFTSWGAGVEIQEDDGAFPIGVSITGQKLLQPPLANIFGGTLTGYPNSSATNWLWGGSHWYKVVLHCTSDKCHGTDLVGPPPGCPGGAGDKPRARVSAARPARGGLAATLAARDPGAPIAGNTIVVAGTGARVFGVPRRPNFIMALGANETISGGAENDQLGALGSNVTINGGAGDDLIFGGPGGTIAGGPGRDQLIERNPGGTILTGSGDEVIASGSHDRVVCSPGARDILIHRRPGDTISPTCRGDRARVLSIRRSGAQRARMAAAIEGNGSNATPYQTACTTKQKDSCTVSTFPARQLDGLWANEFVSRVSVPGRPPVPLLQELRAARHDDPARRRA
jgi:hypothetical protein